jgi:hypothetical protein
VHDRGAKPLYIGAPRDIDFKFFHHQNLASAPFHCCAATTLPDLQRCQADKGKQSPHLFESVPTPSAHWSELAAPPKDELSVLPLCTTCATTTCYETHPGELPTSCRPYSMKNPSSLAIGALFPPSDELWAAATAMACHRPTVATPLMTPLHRPSWTERLGLDYVYPFVFIKSCHPRWN